jgi:hypothetical protein
MCGKHGHLQSAKTTLGLPSKIGFGRPTAWRSGDGLIAVLVRFTRRTWELLKEWIGLHGIHPLQWFGLSINEWWTMLEAGSTPNRKALASLALLTVWEVWFERNSRVFHNKQSLSFVVVNKIKEEARLWVIAGAKKLGSIMLGE